jgi:hypothetical protein
MPGREARLAGAGDADERDEGQLRDRDPHRRNTAIWVGCPSSSSSGPMPEMSAA